MIFPKIRVLRSHGKQYIPDLDAVELTAAFRGRPELDEPATDGERRDVEQAAAICPTGAITAEPFTLDLGRCLFCGECARSAQAGTTSVERPSPRSAERIAPACNATARV